MNDQLSQDVERVRELERMGVRIAEIGGFPPMTIASLTRILNHIEARETALSELVERLEERANEADRERRFASSLSFAHGHEDGQFTAFSEAASLLRQVIEED